MSGLYSKLVRLAHDKPETRKHLLPILAAHTGRMNPAEPFYRSVGQWENGLDSYRGLLTRSLEGSVRRISFATGIPEKTVRSRLLGDAMVLDQLLGVALDDLKKEAERRSVASHRYFVNLMPSENANSYP